MKPAMRMLAMDKLRSTGDRQPGSEYGGNSNRRMIGYDRDGPENTRMPWSGHPHMPPSNGYDDGPEMRRHRDERGRYAMNDRDDEPEARRRRDRRGRYAAYGMDDDDDEDRRPRAYGGNSYGDIFAEGTIYAPGANRPMGGMMGARGKGGRREHYKPVDEEQAMEWVKGMKAVNGIPMPVFRPEAAEAQRKAVCPDCDKWEFFVAINAMYADYQPVGVKYGDKPEFYAMLAKAFLEDPDAGEHKLQKYMEYIPK